MTRARTPTPTDALMEAERLAETVRDRARSAYEELTGKLAPPDIRAQALAGLAILEALRGVDLDAAEEYLERAARLPLRTKTAKARLEHARGYLKYKESEPQLMLQHLNRAAALYPRGDRRRAHVFDTLGLYFHTKGDLDRAVSYYLLSIHSKERSGASERHGLALTYGNLGRLELSRENWAEAERWFRRDLELVIEDRAAPEILARIRNWLANAVMEQGSKRVAEAERILREALSGIEPGSITHAFILKDLARASLRRGKIDQAEKYAQEALEISRGKFEEVGAFARWTLAACVLKSDDVDAGAERAFRAFDEALAVFRKSGMNLEYCQVALDKAELCERLGLTKHALQVLAEGPESALAKAEGFLFEQANPLERIEARIGKIDPSTLAQLRQRRMRGGLPEETHTGRLRQQRERITVWTCDIRGFTAYCDATENPAEVVRMLNRFFGAIGRMLLARGGIIDKYVGDNILAWFRDPREAALAAIDALAIVDSINTERTHLKDEALDIGIGMATGEAVIGCVGFAGKLEHTIIGTVVNRACRLVGEAARGKALMDEATRKAAGRGIAVRRFGMRKLSLKGLRQKVRAYELVRSGR